MPDLAVAADVHSDCLFALQERFPDLEARDITVDERTPGEFVRVDWQDWHALFPQTPDAAVRLRVMASVMPHVRGFVSPAIPIWDVSIESDNWKRSWRAARLPEGRPLHPDLIVDQNRERLVRDLASLFHELHGFSVERARGLGLPSFRAWRDQHEALSRRSRAILRPLLSWSDMTWTRRWWSRFLDDDALWKIEPALVHGAISSERMLVDPLVQELSGVTDWQELSVADPALDFAALIDAYGTELGWRIVEHYGSLGSAADASLFRRIRLQQTVRRFRDIVDIAEREGVESEAMSAAIARLR